MRGKLCALVMLLARVATAANATSPTWPANDAAARAVAAGTRWVVALPDREPAEARLRTFQLLYRITPDAELARTLAPRIERARAEVIASATAEPSDLKPASDDSPHLMRLLNALIVAQEAGVSLPADRARAQAGIERFEWAIPQLGGETWGLWFAYAVQKLGLKAGTSLPAEIAALRAKKPAATPAADVWRLYGFTHVILYESDFARHWVDPAGYGVEREAFRDALRFYRTQALTDLQLDLVGEILGCYRLLRLPPDDDALAVRDAIVRRQNADGSWGQLPGLRYHRTLAALLGLIDFAPELRAGP